MKLYYDEISIKNNVLLTEGYIDVNDGRINVIVGANGAGKTLLLNNIHNNIGGLLVPRLRSGRRKYCPARCRRRARPSASRSRACRTGRQRYNPARRRRRPGRRPASRHRTAG